MSQRKTAAGGSGMQSSRNGSSQSKQKRTADGDINQPGPSSKYAHVQSAEVDLFDGNHNHAGSVAAQNVRVATSSSAPSTPSVIMQTTQRVSPPRRSNNEARGITEGGRKRRAAVRNDQYIQVNEIDSTGTDMCEEVEVDEVEQMQTLEIFQNYFRLINGE